MSVARPRKPSVAASRRFSCADSLAIPGGGARHQQQRGKNGGPGNSAPQIFLDGRNVTPQPLNEADESWSIEDVGYLRPDAPSDGTTFPVGMKRPLAWPSPFACEPEDGSDESTDADDPSSRTERCKTAEMRNATKVACTSAECNSSVDEQPAGDGVPQNRNVVVNLNETPTEFLLVMPGSSVAKDDAEYEEAKARNAAFERTKSRRTDRAGRFKERAAQTFHSSRRNAASAASSPERRDCGVGSSSPRDLERAEPGSDRDDGFVESFTAALTAPNGCLLDVSDGEPPESAAGRRILPTVPAPETIQQVLDEWSKTKILSSPELARAARTIELAIQQTLNGDTQLQYLGIPKGTESLKQVSKMEKLFAFSSAHERPVLSMSWHKANSHNLAVGYGRSMGSADTSGMIMLWSLRNFDHPEQMISTPSEVSALDYSESRPSITACGLLDGKIMLYDTQRSGDAIEAPVAESTFIHGRHQQPVNAVKWMMNQGRHERLISCSSDGRVIQWGYHKGLSLTPLMTLNRSGGTGGAISRVAAGLCISFPCPTATEYIVGTGDGDVISCSTSYSEQHLGIVEEAHAAPILRIRHSPFVAEAFLTCSSDWSTKLWAAASQEDCTLRLELSSGNLRSAVNDVAWSPTVSTVFALVADDGRTEIYDLASSALDPIETVKPSAAEGSMNMKRTTCLFSPDGSNLLAGSSGGKVDVFILPPQLTKGHSDREKEANRLKKIIHTKELTIPK